MDSMMSYCGQYSDNSKDSYRETSFESDTKQWTIEDYDKQFFDVDANNIFDDYKAQIRRKEKEIDSYRSHIEAIEEDYSKVSISLSNAEEEIKQYKKKIYTYEETIDSMKNELDSFYQQENSLDQAHLTISYDNLSFTQVSDIKVFFLFVSKF